jgi:hypothetical protein
MAGLLALAACQDQSELTGPARVVAPSAPHRSVAPGDYSFVIGSALGFPVQDFNDFTDPPRDLTHLSYTATVTIGSRVINPGNLPTIPGTQWDWFGVIDVDSIATDIEVPAGATNVTMSFQGNQSSGAPIHSSLHFQIRINGALVFDLPRAGSPTPFTIEAAPAHAGTNRLTFVAIKGPGAGLNGINYKGTVNYTMPASDNTPPVITPSIIGTAGTNDWYTSDVTVHWTTSDAESAIGSTTGCDDAIVSSDTNGQTFTCSATSTGGTSSQSVTIKRDASAPEIAFGGALSYSVDQTIAITCTASDATSGISSQTCPGKSGDAYLAGVGSHALNASATNGAGLTTTRSATYTVTATAGSVSALVSRWVSNPGVANSLTTKLGNGQINAFINEVQAQTGKKIPADKAAILIQLAGGL